MTKRIVIAGCRDFCDYKIAKNYINFCISDIKKKYNLIFISGGCRGADLLGERYAKENGFEFKVYPANWKKYGKAAGPIRNKQLAINCDYLICFWDGKSKGTKSMINFAKQFNIPTRVKII